MSDIPTARELLDLTSDYVTDPRQVKSAADRPPKIATVDPSYTGSGLPKVRFDGESTTGARTYAWLGSQPSAGDRVVLLPVGNTYVILPPLTAPPIIPAGATLDGFWTTAPTGYLLLDGSVKNRADYPALFTAIGTIGNTGGETSTQFRLPDARGRVSAGQDGATFAALGAKLGEEKHTLSIAEMPSHAHAVALQGGLNVSGPGGGANGYLWHNAGSLGTTSAGSGVAHNIIQPSIVVLKVIKY